MRCSEKKKSVMPFAQHICTCSLIKRNGKRALSRLDLELVAQGVRYRGEIVLAYQTSGSHECALDYYGPELFPQRGVLYLPKNGPKSFHAGGCRLYPGTMAPG